MASNGAQFLREATGTTGLDRTLRDAVSVLTNHMVPHLVAGGFAVQEHGFHRVTLDVDLIVPDVIDAVELLTADLFGPFLKYQGCDDTVRDRRNGVLINFLPAGQAYKSSCKVPFPMPTEVSDIPQFVALPKLISLKLDSWFSNQTRRHKDKTDVIELIKALNLPRELKVDAAVQDLYLETWDALQAEPE
jgi:hypothetical protein